MSVRTNAHTWKAKANLGCRFSSIVDFTFGDSALEHTGQTRLAIKPGAGPTSAPLEMEL